MGLSGGASTRNLLPDQQGAVVNMTRALAVEWAPNAFASPVAPTYVRTRLIATLLESAS